MDDYLRAVIVGEVDAGKSTLIGRFLFEMGSVSKEIVDEINYGYAGLNQGFEFAYLLDSFEEERKNKLTIDTTQVFCKDKKGKGFVLIDVPGHRQLLKNALCGSAYADVAILVVDIQKSIEEGTKNHIHILKFLGIERIVIVLNKMDLTGFDDNIFKNVKSEVTEFCKAAGVAYEYIIPVSASEGTNLVKRSKRMPWYRGPTLITALNNLKKIVRKERARDFYFAVQDNYRIEGEKFLVGPILSGSIHKDETVKITPIGKESRIKKIRIFNRIKPCAREKESAGVVLDEPNGVSRGQILYTKIPPQVTKEITAKIFCVSRLNRAATFTLKCLTQETQAKINRINKIIDASAGSERNFQQDILDEAVVAEVVINTEKPLAIKKYRDLNSLGRFVLDNDREICAVGIIV